jgi:hypothetical protein
MSELEQVKLIEQTVHHTLQRVGLLPSLITRTEMIRIVGSIMAVDRAIADGELRAIRGEGRNSKIMVDRTQFDRWFARLNQSPITIK